MNTSLFRSWYALLALFTVALCTVWIVAWDLPPGSGHGGSKTLLLWTGWIALAFYLAVIAYVARKYVHRVKRAPRASALLPAQNKLESAAELLQQAESEILAGVLSGRKDIEERVGRILRQTGVRRLLRVRVVPGPAAGPAFVLERGPTEPAGRVIVWLHAHLYLGLAAAVLVLLHGGLVYETPMGILLNVSSLVVTATGIVGVYYWAVGPGRLAREERQLSIEQAFSLCEHFSRKLEEALEKPRRDPATGPGEIDKKYDKDKPIWDELVRLRPFFKTWRRVPAADEAREALREVEPEDPKLRALQRDLVVLFCQRERMRAELRRLARTRLSMNAWRIVHVPASIVLVGILIVHVFSIWWY